MPLPHCWKLVPPGMQIHVPSTAHGEPGVWLLEVVDVDVDDGEEAEVGLVALAVGIEEGMIVAIDTGVEIDVTMAVDEAAAVVGTVAKIPPGSELVVSVLVTRVEIVETIEVATVVRVVVCAALVAC